MDKSKWQKPQKQTVANKVFKSKKELTNYTRKLMNDLGPSEHMSGEIFDFFSGMVERHPDAKEKIGTGIKKIKIRPNAMQKQFMEFCIIRTDGSIMDISYKNCVSGRSKSDKANLIAAMRNAIDDQIKSFKSTEQNDASTCYWCFSDISDGDSHADHVVKFKELSEKFIASWKVGPLPSDFDDHKSNFSAVFKAVDFDFETEWAAYHKANAHLVLSCPDCNLKRR